MLLYNCTITVSKEFTNTTWTILCMWWFFWEFIL